MCFYYQLAAKAQDLESRFKKEIPKTISFDGNYWVNGFEFPKMPIISGDNGQFQFSEWGLIPHWAKNDSIKKYTLNARIETISEKPSFKFSLQHRCLVPATGFFEWKYLDSKGKRKQKYIITSTLNKLFSFAGLFSEWIDKNTGEIRNTFTIITTQANELMEQIHNSKKRMPVILNPKDEQLWLEGVDYKQFALPYETKLKVMSV